MKSTVQTLSEATIKTLEGTTFAQSEIMQAVLIAQTGFEFELFGTAKKFEQATEMVLAHFIRQAAGV